MYLGYVIGGSVIFVIQIVIWFFHERDSSLFDHKTDWIFWILATICFELHFYVINGEEVNLLTSFLVLVISAVVGFAISCLIGYICDHIP